jgi:predicted RNA-binding protein
VIVSEPLVLIPYALENRIPDYNLHPIQLSNEVKWEIIRRISHFLKNLKDKQPTRERIYYVGSKHHYEMLMTANNICNTIFELVSIIPFHGIRDYTKAAQSMREIIRENDRV